MKLKKQEELSTTYAAELQRVAQIEERFRAWRKGTYIVSVAFFASVLAILPFLYGHSLHRYWDPGPKYGIYIVLACFVCLVYVAATTYSLWVYLRATQRRPVKTMKGSLN